MDCEYCGHSLPEGSWRSRKYHDECNVFVHRETARLSRQRVVARAKHLKQHPGRVRNPFSGLGLDYVALKLAGKIKT